MPKGKNVTLAVAIEAWSGAKIVITGSAKIDGGLVCVYAQDFTVMGGSVGHTHVDKIVFVMRLARKTKCPFIALVDSVGGRIQEGSGTWAHVFVENREEKPSAFPALKSVDLNDDTLIIVLSKKAAFVRFIHQGGRVVKTVAATDSSFYVIHPNDQYIRTEVGFIDGTVYYLNPVTRYSGDNPDLKLVAKVNVSATGWLRLLYFAAVALMFWYFTRKLPGKNEKKK